MFLQNSSKPPSGYHSNLGANELHCGHERKGDHSGPERRETKRRTGDGVSSDSRWIVIGRACDKAWSDQSQNPADSSFLFEGFRPIASSVRSRFLHAQLCGNGPTAKARALSRPSEMHPITAVRSRIIKVFRLTDIRQADQSSRVQAGAKRSRIY